MSAPFPIRIAALLSVVLASAACSIDIRGSEASTREEKRFTVSAGDPVELTIRTFDGSIEVRSWDRDEVVVAIERRAPDQASAEALVVNQSQEGNRIVLEAPGGGNQRNVVTFGNWITPSVNFIVSAPRRVTLQVRTGDGAIDVQGVEGSVDMDSGDGRIVASDVEGDVKAHTGDGAIRIDRAAGRLDADSGDGSIEVAGRFDELKVRTGDGQVTVDADAGSVVKADWMITTGDGRIAMSVPSEFNAAVDASSGDGPVRVEGIPAPDNPDEREQRRVVGQLGSGGGALRLRTGDGSIEVTR